MREDGDVHLAGNETGGGDKTAGCRMHSGGKENQFAVRLGIECKQKRLFVLSNRKDEDAVS